MFGGEPLMLSNKDLFSYFLKKIKANDYKLYVFTNGVTIEKYLDIFKRYKKQIEAFQITIDGPREIHDKLRVGKDYPKTFTLITNNIDKLLKLRFKINLRTNISKDNFTYLPGFAKFIARKKWNKYKHFSSHIALIDNNTKDCSCINNPKSQSVKYIKKFREMAKKNPELSLYKEENLYDDSQEFVMKIIKKRHNYPKITYCMSCGGKSLTYAADGKIYSCMASVGIDEFCLGEYYPKLLWNKTNLKKWKNRLSINMKKCKKCPLVFICGGNCPLNSYNKYNDIYTPFCANAKKNLEEFVQLNEDRILKFAKENAKENRKGKN